jgi:trehalose-phosphatase
VKSLWANSVSLLRHVASTKSLFLFLDYDGTLTPIADHPSHARLQAETKRLLKQSADLPGVWVALVSGRSLSDLKRIVGIRGLYYVGNHGLELEGPSLRYVNPVAQATQPLLKKIAGELKAALRPIPGAWVEEKGLTFSVHWRNIPRTLRRQFHRLVRRSTAPLKAEGLIRVTRGKRVVEVRPPVAWGKGEMVTWILRRVIPRRSSAKPLVMYLGDDETDEEAFRVTNRCRGLSVRVGRRQSATKARWWVKNPLEVRELLTRIGEAHAWKRKQAP